jgi:hypothetical protein
MPRSKIAQHALVTHMLEAENPNWSILSTGCLVGSMDSDRPELVGDERHVLIEVLRCAGFKQVRIVSQFTLPNRRVPSLKVLHLVAYAARGRVGRLTRWH